MRVKAVWWYRRTVGLVFLALLSCARMTAVAEHGIVPIELVAVNLYPFQMTISRPGVSFEDAVENIDVGGPSMDPLHRAELLVAMLLAMVTLTAVSRRLLVPYPIVLVLGGLVLGLLPGVPDLQLDPGLVFLVFLPPILWSAAYGTSLREFKDHLRPILQLAFGLVIATTLAVGAAAHALLPGMVQARSAG